MNYIIFTPMLILWGIVALTYIFRNTEFIDDFFCENSSAKVILISVTAVLSIVPFLNIAWLGVVVFMFGWFIIQEGTDNINIPEHILEDFTRDQD